MMRFESLHLEWFIGKLFNYGEMISVLAEFYARYDDWIF